MGMSLFNYLLDYRTGRSISFLKRGLSVSDAARQAGFSDASYFSKVFRERTGRLPSHYRKEALTEKEQHRQERGET